MWNNCNCCDCKINYCVYLRQRFIHLRAVCRLTCHEQLLEAGDCGDNSESLADNCLDAYVNCAGITSGHKSIGVSVIRTCADNGVLPYSWRGGTR